MFAIGVCLILLVPGPTNTLLLAGGMRNGVFRSLPLVGAELGGYLLAVTAWGWALQYLSGANEMALDFVRAICACYLAWLARTLWSAHKREQAPRFAISSRSVFIASLCNPKSFVFAMTVFPQIAFQSWQGYMIHTGVFAVCVLVIGSLWITIGGNLQSRGGVWNSASFDRAVALVILTFSIAMVLSLFQS